MELKMRPLFWSAAAMAMITALPVRSASAGVRPYAFAEGVDSLPAETLELENWFGAQKPRAGGKSSWNWWIGPVAGLTDQLEVGLFAIFQQAGSTANRPAPADGGLKMSSLRLQVSYLLAPKGEWPIDVRVRGELGQPMGADAFTTWASVIAAVDLGAFNFTANVGPWVGITKEHVDWYLDASAGASYGPISWLRLGGEIWSSVEFGDPYRVSAGPSIALAWGRVWVTTNVGLGLTEATASVRGRIILGFIF